MVDPVRTALALNADLAAEKPEFCPAAISDALYREALRLAGGIHDLAQRATVYHHLYVHSGGNHVFPLLAAHGALWAKGYFRAGARAGAVLAWQYAWSPQKRRAMSAALDAFADQFRDINRRVCVETYFIYHLTARPDLAALAQAQLSVSLLDAMARCHAARRGARALSNAEKRTVFSAFFLWEQENIVGPAVTKAFAEFDWTAARVLARRPTIRFSYFQRFSPLPFHDFADMTERIDKGLKAFDHAVAAGWRGVEDRLSQYGVMSDEFLRDPKRCFAGLRHRLAAEAPLSA